MSSGSPPWNSIIKVGLGLEKIKSTTLRAVATVISLSVASTPTTLAWQYRHLKLQRRVTTTVWTLGPCQSRRLRVTARWARWEKSC